MGIQWAEARDTSEHLRTARRQPPTECLTQHVRSGEVRQTPSSRGKEDFC